MNNRMKTFVTIFPGYRDFHFYKDPGQIPFRFGRLGYQSSIVFYSDGSPLPDTAKNIKLERIRDNFFTRRFNLGILLWLICNSKKTDILNLFHFTWASLLFAFIYKLINRKGFTYLKLDASRNSGIYSWEKDLSDSRSDILQKPSSLKHRLKSHIIKKVLVNKIDLWSVEDDFTRKAYEAEYSFFAGKLITVFNGHATDLLPVEEVKQYEDKGNIILTAGRLGTEQKATEILLEGFREIAGRCDYYLHLAGTVDPSFKKYIDDFYNKNPELKERIIFHGELQKEELFILYNNARIFCLPSRYEGMAIVFPEAMYFRNVVVTSPFVSPAGAIEEYELGFIVRELNSFELANTLMSVIEDEKRAKRFADNAHEFSKLRYSWNNIVQELNNEIMKRQTIQA